MIIQIAQRIGIPFILLLCATVYFAEVSQGKPQDMMLIKPVFYLMVLLFCVNAATDMRAILRDRVKDAQSGSSSLRQILSFAGLAVLLLVTLPFLGFLISSTLFIFLVLTMFKVENRKILFLMPIGVSATLYALFEFVFAVALPTGFFGF